MKIKLLVITLLFVFLSLQSCSTNNDNLHTTATTYVPPPPHQSLVVTSLSTDKLTPEIAVSFDSSVDRSKPLLHFELQDHREFRQGEVVPIVFSVSNAKLKGDGGDFRVRYIVDDEEMKWVDSSRPFGLSGWVPGKHTVRMELVGPDGWPYRNGNANIVTREILVK